MAFAFLDSFHPLYYQADGWSLVLSQGQGSKSKPRQQGRGFGAVGQERRRRGGHVVQVEPMSVLRLPGPMEGVVTQSVCRERRRARKKRVQPRGMSILGLLREQNAAFEEAADEPMTDVDEDEDEGTDCDEETDAEQEVPRPPTRVPAASRTAAAAAAAAAAAVVHDMPGRRVPKRSQRPSKSRSPAKRVRVPPKRQFKN